jgi:hypothetical protein
MTLELTEPMGGVDRFISLEIVVLTVCGGLKLIMGLPLYRRIYKNGLSTDTERYFNTWPRD